MGTLAQMPPRGHYLADEVGRLAGVSGNTIGQWSRNGYIRASQVSDRYPKVYSYQDTAEAMVVHELLDLGAPYEAVKATIEYLRKELGDWPLSNADLGTVGGHIAALRSDGAVSTSDRPGQGLLDPNALTRVRTALSRGGWAARDLPDLRYIEVNPDRLSGRPTIRGRRIAAEDVARIADDTLGVETLRADYDLSDAEISDARLWWNRMREYEAA